MQLSIPRISRKKVFPLQILCCTLILAPAITSLAYSCIFLNSGAISAMMPAAIAFTIASSFILFSILIYSLVKKESKTLSSKEKDDRVLMALAGLQAVLGIILGSLFIADVLSQNAAAVVFSVLACAWALATVAYMCCFVYDKVRANNEESVHDTDSIVSTGDEVPSCMPQRSDSFSSTASAETGSDASSISIPAETRVLHSAGTKEYTRTVGENGRPSIVTAEHRPYNGEQPSTVVTERRACNDEQHPTGHTRRAPFVS